MTEIEQPQGLSRRAMPLTILSVEDTVYLMLRQEIGRLHFAPNERLRLEGLAARYDVSLTPVRHALRRLESDGLVVSETRKGARVSALTVEELEEIQMIRIGLESFLAACGAERCTPATIDELVAQRLNMEEAYRRLDLEQYLSCFWSFRDACYRAADRPRLLAAVAHQRLRVERYILFLCRDVEAAAQLREPPDRLLEACRERDGGAAESSTRLALLWVLERLRELLTNADGAQGVRR